MSEIKDVLNIFEAEDTVEFWNNGDIVPTQSLCRFLEERIVFNEELDNQYQKYCEDNALNCGYRSALAFAKSLGGVGLYGDGEPVAINTYNHENSLSQDIQYVYWEDEDGSHILLEVHQGGSPMGNYGVPVAFDVDEYIFMDNQGQIYCENCEERWFFDGCHFISDSGDRLNDYEITEEEPEYPWKVGSSKPISNLLWVDDGHNDHCPYCGTVLKFGGY